MYICINTVLCAYMYRVYDIPHKACVRENNGRMPHECGSIVLYMRYALLGGII
jgi:hypothetical protein